MQQKTPLCLFTIIFIIPTASATSTVIDERKQWAFIMQSCMRMTTLSGMRVKTMQYRVSRE